MEYRIIEKKRLLTKDEADDLVGVAVEHREPDITEPSIVVDADTKEPICGYLPMPEEATRRLRKAVLGINYGATLRGQMGWKNASRTFGMAPRKVGQRRESCRPYSLATESPQEHAEICNLSYLLEQQLKDLFPAVWERDKDLMGKVADEWRMAEDALWTSGVVNKTSTLPYHRDGFNFDTWSAMPVVRRGVEGGYLHFPEYDFTLACRDGYSAYFCGFKWVHGVTPMRKAHKDGYRYSVVYYALRGMKDCFTYAMETAKAQEKRTEREEGISAALQGKQPWAVTQSRQGNQ